MNKMTDAVPSAYMVCGHCEKRVPRDAAVPCYEIDGHPYRETDIVARLARAGGTDPHVVLSHLVHAYSGGFFAGMEPCGILREPNAGDMYLETLEHAFGPLVKR